MWLYSRALTWVITLGLHHSCVDDVFNTRNSYGRLCDVGWENDFSAALTHRKRMFPLSLLNAQVWNWLKMRRRSHEESSTAYLRCRLKDSELLGRRKWCVQSDHDHGSAGFRQVFGDVPTRTSQRFNLLLTRHKHQDVMGQRSFLYSRPYSLNTSLPIIPVLQWNQHQMQNIQSLNKTTAFTD